MPDDHDREVAPPAALRRGLLVARLAAVAILIGLIVFHDALLRLAKWPATLLLAATVGLSVHFAIDHLRRGSGPWRDNLVVAGLALAALWLMWS